MNELTESGKRWEELQREYANKAVEQFYTEYPEERPPSDMAALPAPIAPETGEQEKP